MGTSESEPASSLPKTDFAHQFGITRVGAQGIDP
jgi:hypothetical protein